MLHAPRCRRAIQLVRLTGSTIVAQILLVSSLLGADQSTPLHDRIDTLVEAAHVGAIADLAADADFVRRSHLDLMGRIPTASETRKFLQDESPQKRASLVDRLIANDEFSRFFAIVFDVMLLERRQDNRITTADWRKFLEDSLAAKKPFDQLVREILAADGTDAKQRPAAKFYLDRNVETHALTRDVSRMFFGRDIQCAQCHDHPLVNDYLQAEYYGLFSFLDRSFLFEDAKDNKKAYLGEKAEGTVEFASVFEPGAEKTMALPHLPDGLALDGEPRFGGDEAYVVKPAKDSRPVPTFSRREQLARLATHTSSETFARNIANRLWAHMMGHGIVDPVDYHHTDNPPSHPQLLALLANEFVAMQYDVRAFLRELALSRTYQRSIEFPPAAVDASAAKAKIVSLQQQIVEQEAACERLTHEVAQFSKSLSRERENVAQIAAALAATKEQTDAARKTQQEADKQRSDVEQKLAAKTKIVQSVSAAAAEAKKAAAALPDDKDLAAALKTITTRADALQKEAETLTAAVVKHNSEAEEAAARINAATLEQRRLLNERTALVDLVAEARGARRAIRSQYLRAQDQLEEFKQRLTAALYTIDYTDKINVVALAQAAVDEVNVELNSLRDQLAAADTAATELQPRIAQQRQIANEAEQAVTATTGTLEQQQQLLATLQEATEKAQQAAAQLENDQRVADAASALASRSTELSAQLTSATNQHAIKQAKADQARQVLDQLKSQLAERDSKRAATQQAIDQQRTELASAQQELETANTASKAAYKKLSDSWTRRFVVMPLKPLSPEQLAGSTVCTLGLDTRFEREASSEWNSKNKDKKPAEIDEAKKEAEIRGLFEKRVQQVESTFVSLFAAAPASPQDVFNSTVDQALFLANDGRVRNWLQPSDGTLIKRLQAISESDDFATELYLSVLNRIPAADEIREIEDYLVHRKDNRNTAIQELVWGLLTSLEFRFNH